MLPRFLHSAGRGLVLLTLLAAAVAASGTAARADTTGAQIVEPSFLPQTWGYSPDLLTVRAGETVIWTNTGIAPHSVTADDGSFDSGVMLSGAVWSFTAGVPGSYGYFCTLHPDMRGTLIVTEG